jgi:hypothetical protein
VEAAGSNRSSLNSFAFPRFLDGRGSLNSVETTPERSLYHGTKLSETVRRTRMYDETNEGMETYSNAPICSFTNNTRSSQLMTSPLRDLDDLYTGYDSSPTPLTPKHSIHSKHSLYYVDFY